MHVPEGLLVLFCYEFVVPVLGGGIFKRQSAHHKSVEHHSQCEYIGCFGAVLFVGVGFDLVDLRGHVSSFCTFEGRNHLLFLQLKCKSKIGDGDLKSLVFLIFVDEDVVQLDVPMNNIDTVQMLKGNGNLPEQKSSMGEF